MRQRIHAFVLLAFVMVFASGCADQTQVVKIDDGRANPAKVYKNLLVVDVSSDANRQELFENEVIKELRSIRVDAVAAHPTLTFRDNVPRERLTTYANEIGADGILLSRFVSVEASVEVEAGRTDMRSTCRGGDLVDYFLYDHEVISEPDSIKAAYDVVVISSLYDVVTKERVWSIQSTCFDRSNMSDALRDEARIIVQQLRDDDRI